MKHIKRFETKSEYDLYMSGATAVFPNLSLIGYTMRTFIRKNAEGDHTLTIAGSSHVSGETCSFTAIYDNRYDVTNLATWSVLSGSSYATVDHAGELTILPAADASDVILGASYLGISTSKAVVLTYREGSSSYTETEIVVDESGHTTTTTTTVTENEDGSSSESITTVVTDESGNTIGSQESEVTNNADGSSNSTTTNYTAEGEPIDTTNVTGDTNGNVNTQQVEYNESGQPIVTGYEIDTSGSGGQGKDITGNGVDTEFVPFDNTGCGFICHMKFDTAMEDQPRPPLVPDTEDTSSNYLYNIMCAKSPFKGSSSWPGFDIRWAIDKATGTVGTIQFRYSSSGASSTSARSMNGKYPDGSASGNTYDLTITYDPDMLLPTTERIFTVTSDNGCITPIRADVYFDTNNIDFTLGYAVGQSGQHFRFSNVTIKEFTLTKVCEVPSIVLAPPVIACNGQDVTLTCETVGSSIYYDVNQSGNFSQYSSAFPITADTVVRAYSTLNGESSTTVSATCIYESVIADPTITCDGKYVTIDCETPSVALYYRLNETGEYSVYTEAIPITADTVVQAYAQLNGSTSDIVSETCIYEGEVASPVIACDGEIVTITCSTSAASIYYALNQDIDYSLYSLPFAISADTDVYAYATHDEESSTTVSASCEYNPTHDYSQDYLTFKVLSDGTINWKALGSGYAKQIQYSKNGGEWLAITSTSAGIPISVVSGDTVRFKGSNSTYAGSKSNYSGFEGGTASFNIEGNIMSLIYGDNFIGNNTLSGTYNFCSIFKKSNAISAENLVLPATALTNYCYRAMFSYCESLAVAPELPATTLSQGCYYYMFERCAITDAPELAAPTLVKECYFNMFNACSHLNYIKCLATNISASACTTNWVTGVASSGTFVKATSMSSWTTGVNGIPTNWIVYNDEVIDDPIISCDGQEITISCATSGADVYYKLNGEGNFGTYTVALPISADTLVESYAEKSGQQSNTVSANCVYIAHIIKFGDLQIASGPLYYNGTAYAINDSWNMNSYDSVYGKISGSTYFSFEEMGDLFEASAYTAIGSDIINMIDPLDGWRLPTSAEMATIIGTSRSGSTVNGTANKHYALVKISGADTLGILIFPDGETFSGETFMYFDNTIKNVLSAEELNSYVSSGCAFLPCVGCHNTNGWEDGDYSGSYWVATECDNNNGYLLSFRVGNINTTDLANKTMRHCSVRLVKDATYNEESPFEAANKVLNNWDI